jgi:hypothetical protein
MSRIQLSKDPAPAPAAWEVADGGAQQVQKIARANAGYEAQQAALSPSHAVQAKGGVKDTSHVHETAQSGVEGSGSTMPHADAIQKSFGSFDVSGVRAHVGGSAAVANKGLGSEAYATGNRVAFSEQPSLQTAAHEAAHVIQQQAGVQLKGGVGAAGDAYERHADRVADAVVQGHSAEAELGKMVGQPRGAAAGGQTKATQFIGTPLDQALPAGAEAPAHGEDQGKQRRYTREQYIAMWEKEQGHKMTPAERATIERGCIGITATNLAGGGNPLDYAEKIYGTFEQALGEMKKRNAELGPGETKYAMFAKMFWSNQSRDPQEAMKHDEQAFKPDPITGEVDMAGYEYRAQPKPDGGGYVNFDYAFWDESSNSFWHANHMEYKDPGRRESDPMKVLQSTKEKFQRGYIDFDRTIYGIARAENYDPALAAMSHAGR